ncbi:uncharacterized protein N7483_000928 [Penicillium malachiteum]|uniref:uncharacterized protein n=1 Tax=Penicillium malachiteum TaxID=1324776 RepID=UPI002546EB6E|nr:uncharacterized protein N7483_000928 [Penicillium malachiteum]KAJ5735803.1 hypothetical protein N7483_000928 [Penicillium malachiteum]
MTILQFLRKARQIHLQFLSGSLTESPIYVLGNPSADLDSIISAIIYSYCANNHLPSKTPRPHIPLLNLPKIPSGPDLYRLRPEFVTALWLSTPFPALRPDEQFEDSAESAGNLLRDHIITVADFAQSLHDLKPPRKHIEADTVLVDWNALPERLPGGAGAEGKGSLGGVLSEVTFHAVGCIDHHVDERFMPDKEKLPFSQPIIIQPGPGSCSSLITNEMRERGLWGSGSDSASVDASSEMAQAAKLALAAILIDTSNLQAEGKVTQVDVRAVEFLQAQVAAVGGEEGSTWDMEKFYEQVLWAKQNSLDRLTLSEVLGRDYKEWTETAQSSGTSMTIGFCSSVKPIRWILRKAGGSQAFLDGIQEFASSEGRHLDAVVVMTSFTSKNGEFARELFVSTVEEQSPVIDGIKSFVENSASQLDLVTWSTLDGESVDIPDEEIRSTLDGDEGIWRRLWIQKNTKASRKQVAPLMRDALSKL